MGFKLAAFTEGSRPKTMPISMENPTLAAAAGMLITAGVPLVPAINRDRMIPAMTPRIPPQLVSTADSVRNWKRILLFLAPTAFFSRFPRYAR